MLSRSFHLEEASLAESLSSIAFIGNQELVRKVRRPSSAFLNVHKISIVGAQSTISFVQTLEMVLLHHKQMVVFQ